MALRVLLADESSTIKKVFQLALQDYAVDVCAVTIGLDVLTVAKQFKPDVIFCDILLQKKNGYEVCSEIKNDDQIKALPVILMWSGFMELDEDKLQAARADGHLEKPFDVDDLRKIINQFVPKTKDQRLSSFLTFPKMPEMLDPKAPPPPVPGAGGGLEEHSSWNMESFDSIPVVGSGAPGEEEFHEVPLPPAPKTDEFADDEEDAEDTQWSAKDLSQYKLDLPADDNDLAVSLPSDDEIASPLADLELQEPVAASKESPPPAPVKSQSPQIPTLSAEQIEKIVRSQCQSIIESVVWKVVPDLAGQIIERELKKLLAEKDAPTQF